MDMETVLKGRDGILNAKVSASNDTVDIRYDPEKLDERDLFVAVRKLGFKTAVMKQPSAS
jgi:copper chaperone CopZ